MRYYVLVGLTDSVIPPHIIAEVVRDVGEDLSQREESLAGRFAAPGVRILTFEELLAMPDGRAILHAWDTGNDTNFYLEDAWFDREDQGIAKRHLRVVPDTAQPDERKLDRGAYLIKHSAYLQLQSAELIARVRGLRALRVGMLPTVGRRAFRYRPLGSAGSRRGEAI